MNVTNKSSNPLGLPGNSPIMPGATAKVENWSEIKDLPVIVMLIQRDVIETGGKVGESDVTPPVDVSPAAQLAAINARQAAAEAPIMQPSAPAQDEPESQPEQPAKRGRKTKTDNADTGDQE